MCMASFAQHGTIIVSLVSYIMYPFLLLSNIVINIQLICTCY